MRRTNKIKKLTALTLALMMVLTLAACGGNTNPPANNSPTPTQNGNQQTPSGNNGGNPIAPNGGGDYADEVTFAAAKGFDEDETIFRITVPGLQERISGIQMFFKEDSPDRMEIQPKALAGNRFRFWGDDNKIRGMFEGDDVVISFYEPDRGKFDRNSIDSISIQVLGNESGAILFKVNLQGSDINEMPLSDILPGMASFRDFNVDPDSISINTVDNGDGTLTFTYCDVSMKQEYIYPWEWRNDTQKNNGRIRFEVEVYGLHATTVQDNTTVIGTRFAFTRGLAYGADTVYEESGNHWMRDTVNMTNAIMLTDQIVASKLSGENTIPDGFLAIVDENGLTATWTVSFNDGYSYKDIIAFEIRVTQFLASGEIHLNDILHNVKHIIFFDAD